MQRRRPRSATPATTGHDLAQQVGHRTSGEAAAAGVAVAPVAGAVVGAVAARVGVGRAWATVAGVAVGAAVSLAAATLGGGQ